MSETIEELDTEESPSGLATPGYSPYGQLIKMLLPRSTGVAIYDKTGSLSWSSTGYDKPEFRELVSRFATIQSQTSRNGTIRMTSAGYPAFFATIQSGRRFLGSLIVDLGQTRDVWNETVIAGLLTPVLRCLENCLELERSVHFNAARDDDALDLLLGAEEVGAAGSSPLHRILQHTIKHLGCAAGALVITEKNLLVACNADGVTTKSSQELLSRTQKHLLAWAQLNNRPMLVNRVGPGSKEGTYKILSCPVRNSEDKVNGVLALFRDEEQSDFDLKDVRILEFIARRAVAIIHNSHDPLTGLANRLVFERRVQEQLDCTEKGAEHAVLYIDIDRLQAVNEAFGYHVGDEVIQRMGEAVLQQLRPVDNASRFGGDRLAVYLHGSSLPEAKAFAENLTYRMSQISYKDNDAVVQVSISIGLVAVGPNARNLSHILAEAERACQEAKSLGKNRVIVGSTDTGTRKSRSVRDAFSANLQNALANNEFRLDAQIIKGIALNRGETMGHEILLRVRDPDGQVVAPDKVLDAAERYGLTAAIDRWVIARAARSLAEGGFATADTGRQITLNVSEHSLQDPGFADFVLSELANVGLPPRLFRFDINESAALHSLKEAEAFVRAMAEAGAHTGLDDFGLGLSSFANLKHLPVQYLKIDGSLIRRILTDSYAESVVKGIVKAAEILGVFTIAEHVESEEIAATLEALDVHFGQGYYFGRPQPLEAASLQEVAAATS